MSMSTTLGDLLRQRPSQWIVGRERELEALLATATGDQPLVMFVHGLGGMGKTTLLDRFADVARRPGATVLQLDCRAVEPTPRGPLAVVAGATGESDLDRCIPRLADLSTRVVLALDAYEAFGLADSWIRQELLPSLPANARLVMASRRPPGRSGGHRVRGERPCAAWPSARFPNRRPSSSSSPRV